ncbi:MAG: hypothetical protein HWE39_24205 [Oceanospirillaceae bacterium]|nr:hypothetical protein [Oceanospirillaceae bacterium]
MKNSDIFVRLSDKLRSALEARAEEIGLNVPELFRFLFLIDLRYPEKFKPDKGYGVTEGSLTKIRVDGSTRKRIAEQAKMHGLTRSRYLRSIAIRELEKYTDFVE